MTKHKLFISTIFLLALISLTSVLETNAQFAYRQTIGNETENQYQPGGFHAIKYRAALISSPDSKQNTFGQGNFTRHTRLNESTAIGGSTGIGGSTLQTASVTSESRPALIRPVSISTGTPLITRPDLRARFESSTDSPALRTFPVQYPNSGERDFFGRTAETFTNSDIMPQPINNSISSDVDKFEFGK